MDSITFFVYLKYYIFVFLSLHLRKGIVVKVLMMVGLICDRVVTVSGQLAAEFSECVCVHIGYGAADGGLLLTLAQLGKFEFIVGDSGRIAVVVGVWGRVNHQCDTPG